MISLNLSTKIQVGDTFPKGTWVGYYKHLENGEGLPIDGWRFYWNQQSTGTTSDQWQSLAYTRTPLLKLVLMMSLILATGVFGKHHNQLNL